MVGQRFKFNLGCTLFYYEMVYIASHTIGSPKISHLHTMDNMVMVLMVTPPSLIVSQRQGNMLNWCVIMHMCKGLEWHEPILVLYICSHYFTIINVVDSYIVFFLCRYLDSNFINGTLDLQSLANMNLIPQESKGNNNSQTYLKTLSMQYNNITNVITNDNLIKDVLTQI